ncbi:MAG: TIGR04100 family radical SAM protein [Clostridiales bacterium]|nr:TIGR04100 family radical SAM protein [Clostridiales bacterium]
MVIYMSDIIYTLDGGTYLNITNKCPCNCVFCIRSKGEAVGDAKRLWHDTEPTFEDVKKAVDNYDFGNVNEAVFCGYGEPTNSFDVLIKTAKYLKEKYPHIKLRINTNGLSDLINGRSTAKEICSVIDIVSVSLNDPSSEKYDKITRNIYPGKAFQAMLKFTKDCVKCGADVRMTVVDVIPPEDIEKSREICKECGAAFRVRSYSNGR